MKKIIQIEEIEKLEKYETVLIGGCFDVIHIGHIDFLNKAKKEAKKLVVLLESDENIKITKGKDRPINRQADRANVLLSLKSVDFVVMLPEMKNDNNYEEIIKKIRPTVIAVTDNDERINNKTRQAEGVKAKIVVVNQRIKGQSSSKIIAHMRSKPDKIVD